MKTGLLEPAENRMFLSFGSWISVSILMYFFFVIIVLMLIFGFYSGFPLGFFYFNTDDCFFSWKQCNHSLNVLWNNYYFHKHFQIHITSRTNEDFNTNWWCCTPNLLMISWHLNTKMYQPCKFNTWRYSHLGDEMPWTCNIHLQIHILFK